jgi:HTH-type transcriptional regulator/antitoxin HigA
MAIKKRRKTKTPKAPIRPLRSEADYVAAVDMIERYFENEPKPGTAEADRFDLLALVIEDYEKKRWPIEPPDPIDAIRYRMETGNFSQADLGRVVGSRQRASDILKRKRRLTMQMAWALHRKWDIPAEALIRPPGWRAVPSRPSTTQRSATR